MSTISSVIRTHIPGEKHNSVTMLVEVTPELATLLEKLNELVLDDPLDGAKWWRRSREWDGSGVLSLEEDVVLRQIVADGLL